MGQWIVLLSWGGALLDYPVLLWLDPLAMFSGLFGIQHAGSSPEAGWFAISLAGVLILSVVWPGAWCARVCPLGATQDILSILAARVKKVAKKAVCWSPEDVSTRPKVSAGLPRRAVLGAMAGVGWATTGNVPLAATGVLTRQLLWYSRRSSTRSRHKSISKNVRAAGPAKSLARPDRSRQSRSCRGELGIGGWG